jgi:hypothetical protein
VSKLYAEPNSDQWLLNHARNVTSISGEDGIIEKIFEVIPAANKWCVEFGAWDGKTYSNTYHLMQERGWSGVFVEADPAKFRELTTTYQGNARAHCVNCFVNFEGENTLDAVLARAGAPRDLDLLSIDIDGNDYHVWDSLKQYQPRVVIIEFNPTIPSSVEFIQPRDMSVQQGNSLLSLVKLGRQKGYELICVTDYNAIFVLGPLLPAFRIANKDADRLRPPATLEFQLFLLYDGTFVMKGPGIMPWHSVPMRQEQFQALPKMFRGYPPESLGFVRRVLRWIWFRLGAP